MGDGAFFVKDKNRVVDSLAPDTTADAREVHQVAGLCQGCDDSHAFYMIKVLIAR